MWRKKLEKFIHTTIVNELAGESNREQTSILREKPERKKPQERERIHYNIRGLRLQSLGFVPCEVGISIYM